MTKLKEFAALTRVIRDISQLVFVELDASYQEELKKMPHMPLPAIA